MVAATSQTEARDHSVLASFVALLPTLAALTLASRAVELFILWPAGLSDEAGMRLCFDAIITDLLALARYLPAVLLLCLLPLSSRSLQGRIIGTSLVLGGLVVAHGALSQYRASSGVFLGSEFLNYSSQEIEQAVSASRPNTMLVLSVLLILIIGAFFVAERLRRRQLDQYGTPLLLCAALCLGSWALAAYGWYGPNAGSNEDLRTLRTNSLAYFVDDVLSKEVLGGPAGTSPAEPEAAVSVSKADRNGFEATDPAYPFLHKESTPDDLGPLLNLQQDPPDIVMIIVEGLGRSFSGPGARLGSFTPFLDSLAKEGLYWENFVAPQGRTFGVIPTLLGSAPFGEQGILEMPPPLPAHATLPMLLRSLGYHSRYFGGFDADADNQRNYLEQFGFERVVDRTRIARMASGQPVPNELGYDDDYLLKAVQEVRTEPNQKAHRLDLVQTNSMRDPYKVPQHSRWLDRVDSRLGALGIDAAQLPAYREHRDIYASILFTDEALRNFFTAVRKDASYANTLFIITGDHGLPELPTADYIERYHVPLIIWSPLIKEPRSIKAVSSHFDVTPSLAALYASHYGLKRPDQTTWLGRGLDVAREFRSLNEFPLKQSKSQLTDFISGSMFLGRGKSYVLKDGLLPVETSDSQIASTLRDGFSRFVAANAVFSRSGRLQPPTDAAAEIAPIAATTPTAASDKQPATVDKAPPATKPQTRVAKTAREPTRQRETGPRRTTRLAIANARIEPSKTRGQLLLKFSMINRDRNPSVTTRPLAVLMTAAGKEVKESYGVSMSLAPQGRIESSIVIDTKRISRGSYYLAVYPSDPGTGKRIGEGLFRIPVYVAN